jgi:hypothetical protein
MIMADSAHHRLGRECSFAGNKMGHIVGEHKRDRRYQQLLQRPEVDMPFLGIVAARGRGARDWATPLRP